MCGDLLVNISQRPEGRRYFQKARDVGEAHGFFLVESKACIGLGEVAVSEGRYEEGLELLRNGVVAARLGEGEVDTNELVALSPLIIALFKTRAIDEVEPLVLRFRELSKGYSDLRSTAGLMSRFFFKLKSLIFNARLHVEEPPLLQVEEPLQLKSRLFFKLKGLFFNARLHEVLCIQPVLGTPSSFSGLAFRQPR